MSGLGALPERWRRDRLVCSDRVGLREARLVADDEALVTVVAGPDGSSVAAYGERGAAVRRLVALVAAGEVHAPLRWLTLPREVDLPPAVATALDVEPLPGWDWLSTDSAPDHVPREDEVLRLDPARHSQEIRDCLLTANPGTEADPCGPHEVAWWGVRGGGGSLVGVIGASRRGAAEADQQTWHLHGLGVAPTARRQGLGRALTAAATRDGLGAGAAWVSLGVWADNAAALAMYGMLGFRTDHRRRSYRPAGERATHPRD